MTAAPGDPAEALRPRLKRQVDGLLLLDKPTGITSNAALQRVKWLLQARKAGHTGSLDPLASGMLPICFGEATKFSGYLLGADKIYEVRALWGQRTDTGDADGVVIEDRGPVSVGQDALLAVLPGREGAQRQVPPMYSALKQGGQRLYALARAGKEVPREPRDIHVSRFELVEFHPSQPLLRVRCSKGTYVRTLIEDLAAALGTVAHVVYLRRLAVLPFAPGDMVTLPDLELAAGRGVAELDGLLLAPDAGIRDWPSVPLDETQAHYLLRGNSVAGGAGLPVGLARVYGPGGQFLGVGEILADGRLAPRRLVAVPPAPLPRSLPAGCH